MFLGCQWFYNVLLRKCPSFNKKQSELSRFQMSQTLHALKPVKSVVTMTRTAIAFSKTRV